MSIKSLLATKMSSTDLSSYQEKIEEVTEVNAALKERLASLPETRPDIRKLGSEFEAELVKRNTTASRISKAIEFFELVNKQAQDGSKGKNAELVATLNGDIDLLRKILVD